MTSQQEPDAASGREKKRKLWKHPGFVVVVACTALPYFHWPTEVPPALSRGAFMAAFVDHWTPQREVDPAPRPTSSPKSEGTVVQTLEKIRGLDFSGAESVMTGRYLRDYEVSRDSTLLTTTNLSLARLVKRGERWMDVEAPYTPADQLYATRYPWENASEKKVRLRLVEQGGSWKLEHVKVVTGDS